MSLRKDRSLDELARIGNVAQFVSYSPGGRIPLQQYCRVAGHEPNYIFDSVRAGLNGLIESSPEGTINLRSFASDNPRSRDFHYGVANVDEAHSLVERMSGEGLFVIANETVDVSDGGVSGVIQGGVAEFAPDDTPRCVEKEGTASLPYDLARSVIRIVFGFEPETVAVDRGRLEFSIHPKPRGWRRTHTLMWEYEGTESAPARPAMKWPNRFSQHIGDKTFGLLIAHAIGLSVPRTTCFARRVAPFTFGRDTASREVWTRTCPREPEPGRYMTVKGWTDPFKLLAIEDPQGTAIPAVLCQAAVPATHSGAAITDANGQLVIEGTVGEGDDFMLGQKSPEKIPASITDDVRSLYEHAKAALGPVRFEWVHDGSQAWIVQLHKGATDSAASTIVPGDAPRWEVFQISRGLEVLRGLLDQLPRDVGICIEGEIGLTSHIADLLRKARRPARIQRSGPTGH